MTLAPWKSSPGYLSTASFGIPCPAAVEAVATVTTAWAGGTLGFGSWLADAQLARASIARLLSVPPEHVALGTSTALLLSSIASSLPDNSRVLAPVNEHNSNLIPYLNQAHRGITVELVPLAELADRVNSSTTLVSCSAVQSLTGEVADIEAIRSATRATGSIFCLDGSQACGWLPLSGASADVIVCSVYKWLCSPLGGAFLVMTPEMADRFRPATLGWAAGVDPMAPPYGTEFVPAPGARKFDTVPNLVSMLALRRSVDAIVQLGIEAVRDHDVALANRFRNGLHMDSSNSAIVTLPREGGAAELAKAGIRATEWRGILRLSFHLHNSQADVDQALTVLAACGQSRGS
jgi:selenocysteine lyase/cysteine desulfurase